jgi:hypothetical protein
MKLNSSDYSSCNSEENDVSKNARANRTIGEDLGIKEPLELFVDMLDAFYEECLNLKFAELLKLLCKILEDAENRLSFLEDQVTKRTSIESGINRRELADLAEFRILEHGGRISQKKLQRELGIKSRSTMTDFVQTLGRTGRFSVRRHGRENMIEVVS